MDGHDPAVYLDNAATTPLAGGVLDAMLPFLRGAFGNPSSVHGPGVLARRAVESAREAVAAALAGRAGRVVFTSGGTEANNLAVRGFAAARQGDRLVVSAVEHPSVGNAAAEAARAAGVAVARVRVDPSGRLDLAHLADVLTPRTSVVALIHGQNETGVLQPIAEAAAVVRERAPRALLHVDAVQSFGKVDLEDVAAVADSIALSAHKVHGPKGAGALVLFTNVRPAPQLAGGGQEGGLRSGTENVAALVGFGVAAGQAAAARRTSMERLALLTERIAGAFAALQDATVLGQGVPRLPNLVTAVVRGVRGEVLQHHLEQQGVVIATGSACHAARGQLSATWSAFGLADDEARSTVRVSLSRFTTEQDVDRFVTALPAAVNRIRELVR